MSRITTFWNDLSLRQRIAIGAIGSLGAVVYLAIRRFPITLMTIPFVRIGLKNLLTGTYQCDRVLNYVLKNSVEGNPKSVMKAIDDFARTDFLINVGPVKGEILRETVNHAFDTAYIKRGKEASEKGNNWYPTMAEMGGFMGYSALLVASMLKEKAEAYNDPHCKPRYISMEYQPIYAAVATRIIRHAGLSDIVDIRIGPASQTIPKLTSLAPFDLVFIDHVKSLYLSDAQLLLKHKLLATGSYLVADNILVPGAPEYRAWMRDNNQFDSIEHMTSLEYHEHVKDIVLVSRMK